MKKPILLILILVSVIILAVAVWFLISYFKYLSIKSSEKVNANITDAKSLGELLRIDINDKITTKALEAEIEDEATIIYIHFCVQKEYLAESEMKFGENSRYAPNGVDTALMGKFKEGKLGFDANRISYVKTMFKNYTILSLTRQTITSMEIFAFVEKEEADDDYVNVYLFTIVPEHLTFDTEGILGNQ